MKVFCISLFVCVFFSIHINAQKDSIALVKIATEIEHAFTTDTILAMYDFGPVKILFANFSAFQPGNNFTTAFIRKTQASKKFKSDDSLFQWLIPEVNRKFLSSYFGKRCHFKGQYDSLFNKFLQPLCPCITLVSNSKDAYASTTVENCMKKFVSDSSLIKEYRDAFYKLPDDDKLWFLEDLLFYANTHCETMFNKLIVLAKEEIPGYFKTETEHYKASLLQEAVRYSMEKKEDSLKMIFPAHTLFAKELAAWKKLYNDYNGQLSFTIGELVANNTFERKNLLVAIDNVDKIKLLAQFVYEIGIDKPVLYIRNAKYYSRESLQSVQWLEAEMEKAKAKIH